MERGGYIYIVSNYERTTLYIGVTANLSVRIFDHASEKDSEFAAKYKCKYLIYFEGFQNIEEAIAREKVLKKWKRQLAKVLKNQRAVTQHPFKLQLISSSIHSEMAL
jgi:putative endonuclease